jgi:glutamate carboxypeptidase
VSKPTDPGEAAARWLEGALPRMEQALRPLVEVNSFTGNREGGNQVGALLRALFDLPGLAFGSVPSARFADHLVLRSQGKDGVAAVALVGHLDTVFPPGAFEGYRVDGPLRRGPGVLDMKGGLVVVAFALQALARTCGLGAIAPLRVVVVTDEEIGSPEGADVIRAAIAGAGAALVFESGRANDAVITARKGTGAITAIAHGKASHAGNAHAEGHNAIWALARFIDRVQGLTDPARGITVNVGKVGGGQGKNTVPDLAEALVDLRFCSRADGEQLVTEFRAAAEQAAASVPGTRIEVQGGVAREPLERTPQSARLLALYGECARASGLGCSESPLVGGGSDASTASGMGIPAIDGLGPRGRGFHTLDEHIEADTLVPKAQALARMLARLSEG